ncbi:heme lyase CcmF/NrfE family subunit [Pleionea sediminis]|uniref:heme lyase CcmF/NrfE family subunit n=1 Tax=Pleionea sediminis TaxID=2569479 RepID=UPI00118663BD|nr:heme lyase CcmF/NrfE family subunit [Pleionea sediminis]
MIVEIAHFCLILALVVAVVTAIAPMWGSFYNQSILVRFARPATHVMFVLIFISFAGLVHAFATDNFTVSYVANHSYSRLPFIYKICAVWGAHEGSMLLWILVLAGWSSAVALFSRQLPEQAVARVLSVMAFISVGFLSFAVFTSNPFERLLPYFPIDGRDLNPLLQDFGFIIHPPFLYMGYVGFAVAFAFAISALISGELDSAWARWSRPWTVAAWIFLTIGISLGSWWAYYELGWGGWWFWDPVENASFMPWLTGTALIHTLAVSEKRGVFKAWTVFLALITFCLSLLGTFIVRSGVITSVHSFAQDPVRGLFILIFLAIVVIAALTLFIFRAGAVRSTGRYQLLSKESFLLFNNVLLAAALLVVLFGTLFPLIMEAFDQSVSVGAPYFNLLFPICMLPLLALLGIGHWLHWKNHPVERLLKTARNILFVAIIFLVAMSYWIYSFANTIIWISLFIAFWIISSILYDVVDKTKHGQSRLVALKKLKSSYWGMQLAHSGLAVTLVGIVMVEYNSIEKLIRFAPNDQFEVANYQVTFDGLSKVNGPNYIATRGSFTVNENGKEFKVHSEKRRYTASGQIMTEAGINPGFSRDVYISLGEKLEGNEWSVRIYIKSFVRWIWFGTILMALGGLLAMSDRRYRLKLKQKIA